MTRKTKRCARVWLDQSGGRLTIRTCVRLRGHDEEDHIDEHGAWKDPHHNESE